MLNLDRHPAFLAVSGSSMWWGDPRAPRLRGLAELRPPAAAGRKSLSRRGTASPRLQAARPCGPGPRGLAQALAAAPARTMPGARSRPRLLSRVALHRGIAVPPSSLLLPAWLCPRETLKRDIHSDYPNTILVLHIYFKNTKKIKCRSKNRYHFLNTVLFMRAILLNLLGTLMLSTTKSQPL